MTATITKEDIAAGVKEIFAEEFGADLLAKAEGGDDLFKPAGAADRLKNDLDSLDKVDFIMAVEDSFDITISDVEAELCRSLEDVVNTVDTHLSKPRFGAR